MWLVGGHLGGLVSALVDGQLDAAAAERSWTHVLQCGSCRAGVEREVWVKNQLAALGSAAPPPGLAETIDRLARVEARESERVTAAWDAVAELERRHRTRRVGLVAAGAGTVGAAMIGLGALSLTFDLGEPRPAGAVVGRDRPVAPVVPPGGRPADRPTGGGTPSLATDLTRPTS
jgi:hypothetical protein